jgi:hypothetical protein
MRCAAFIFVMVIFGGTIDAHRRAIPPMPDSLEIGRHTFFDNGPENFYEIFLVRAANQVTSIQRITLSAPHQECELPEKIEIASATVSQSVESLLGSSNPCAIPEKELRRELKRCKHCLVFSYSDVTMQVRCGTQMRLIRADVLDRDWFGPRSDSRKNTDWTMDFLQRLDQAVGPSVMEKPVFPAAQESAAPNIALDPAVLKVLEEGGYDGLFPGAPRKMSEFFASADRETLEPEIEVKSVVPVRPDPLILPQLPQVVRLVRIDGTVTISGTIGPAGYPVKIVADSGPNLLLPSVISAALGWKFPAEFAGQQMHAAIKFNLNCHPRSTPAN